MNIDKSFVVLRRSSAQLTLDPQRGGAIREFSCDGRDVLRPTPESAGDDPLDMACFPMVPFVNRIADGRFDFGGHAFRSLEMRLLGSFQFNNASIAVTLFLLWLRRLCGGLSCREQRSGSR